MDMLVLKVTLLLTAALAAASLLRRAPAAVRHALWTATFASILALPLLLWTMPTIGIPVATEDAVHPPDLEAAPSLAISSDRKVAPSLSPSAGAAIPIVGSAVAPLAAPAAVTPTASPATASQWPRPTAADAVRGIWLAGVVAALAALGLSLVRVHRLAAAAEVVVDPDWGAALAEVSESFGRRRPPRLLVSPLVAVPMAGGVWRPTIFLPRGALNWPIDQRAVVLSHETAHMAALDPLRHLMARLALAIYWFHPLAWLAARQANTACEQTCDQAVVLRGVLPSTYARVLLALAETGARGRHALAALPIVSRSRLERRLMAILDDRTRCPRRGVAWAVAVAVLLAAGAVGPLAPVSVAQPDVEPMVISEATETPAPPPAPASRLAQQPTAPGPRAIAGRVVDGSTGQPVPRASVRLSHQPPVAVAPLGSPEADRLRMPAVTIQADQDGRFAFDTLPEGRFGVSATSGDYGTGYFGQQSASDSTGSNARIDLAPGERLTDITIRLWRVATFTGRVTNEQGDPVVGSVQVFQREYIAGRPAWIPRRSAWMTDWQGAYRVPDLPAGDYLVALVGKPGVAGAAGYPSVFYPASPRAAGARVITVAPGESRSDINFPAARESGARTVPVSGRVAGDVSPLPSMTVQLVPADAEDGVADVEALTAETSATGDFTFPRVPLGEHRLLASIFPAREPGVGLLSGTSSFNGFSYATGNPLNTPRSPTWVLDRVLTVDRPLEDIQVPLQQGARIHGRVLFEGPGPAPGIDALRGAPILVRPARMRHLGRVPFGGVEADGQFHTAGFPPGQYVLTLLVNSRSSPELLGWYVASIRVGGRETTGQPIELGTTDLTGVELVLSNRPMRLSGVVHDSDGRPVPWARVIMFPRDRALWGDYVAFPAPRRIRQIVADRFGAFEGAWVPSGEYVVAATATVPEFWMAPEFLNTLVPFATPLRVELGGQQSLDLRTR